MIKVKDYQENAIAQLLSKAGKFLQNSKREEILVFQAPTGSGKTVMLGKFIGEIIAKYPDETFTFLWATFAKGDLHYQSAKSLRKILSGVSNVSMLENDFVQDKKALEKNEILVVNWEKIRAKDGSNGAWTNVVMREGEKINFLDVLRNTNKYSKMIVIIDESHYGFGAERISELRKVISPEFYIEVSATPSYIPSAQDIHFEIGDLVRVSPSDVINEGMIKKEILINPGVGNLANDELDSQEVIIKAAYDKRIQLRNAYIENNSEVNPLVLIQIPNGEAGKEKQRSVLEQLEKLGATVESGEVAIYIDGVDKADTINWIAENHNPIQYLIFKQAIDTGWDCPRAQILIRLREIKSITFEVQTLGRILRMAELRHYRSEILNRAYVYTNINSIVVKHEEFNPNIVKHLRSERNIQYSNINLISYYKSRADYGDIGGSFTKVFAEVANYEFGIASTFASFEENLLKLEGLGVNIEVSHADSNILIDKSYSLRRFDTTLGEIAGESHVNLKLSNTDLRLHFEELIMAELGSFRSIKRSLPSVRAAIYVWFRDYLGTNNWESSISRIQSIFTHSGNSAIFTKILREAISKYEVVRAIEVREKIANSEQFYEYEIPEELFYNQHIHEEINAQKHLHAPCFLRKDRSKPEKDFEDYLENNSEVDWWWKNGTNLVDFFGIKYTDEFGFSHIFYPDYLVMTRNRRLGILETKSDNDPDGPTTTTLKAVALHKFVSAKNTTSNIFGGIVVKKKGQFLIHDGQEFNWNLTENGDWSQWASLSL